MMDDKALKKIIIEGLGSRLGTYSVAGQTVPAVWIGGKVPGTYTVKGLEVIINPTPDTSVTQLIGGDSVVTEDYVVRFVERSPGTSLQDVVRWMVSRFAIQKDPVMLPETDTMFHQVTFYIPQYSGVYGL